MSMTENARAYRARNLRYKRAALASMGFDFIRDELDEMRETCNTIHWWSDQDEETLLNALDGDEDDVWEFKMVFSDLEARADRLFEKIYELCRYEDNFGQTYDDCTVALIGNRYRTVGFDSFEEDYFSLTGYESDWPRLSLETTDAENQSGDHFHRGAVLRYSNRLPGFETAVRLLKGHF